MRGAARLRAAGAADVLIGDAATKIVRVAKSERVHTIVMGTRGMGALGNLALGSTAIKVIHLAEVPVTSLSDPAATRRAVRAPCLLPWQAMSS